MAHDVFRCFCEDMVREGCPEQVGDQQRGIVRHDVDRRVWTVQVDHVKCGHVDQAMFARGRAGNLRREEVCAGAAADDARVSGARGEGALRGWTPVGEFESDGKGQRDSFRRVLA